MLELNKAPSNTKRSSLFSVAANILWLTAERGVQILVALFISGLIARSFGPELYGKWQYALSLLFLIGTVTYFCGAEVIVPKLVRKSLPENEILGTAFLIRILGSTIAVAGSFIYLQAFNLDSEVKTFLAILLILLFFTEPFAVITAWFQARTNISPIVRIRISALIFKSLLVFIILHTEQEHYYVATAWIVEAALIALGLFYVHRRLQGNDWKVNKSSIFPLLKEGILYWPGIAFMCIFVRLDRLFLAEATTYRELGFYSAAIQIAENWFILATLLSQTIAPRYIFAKLNSERIKANIKTLLLAYLFISTLGSILIATIAPFLIRKIFGAGYEESAELLRLAVFVSIPIFIDSLFTQIMLKNGAAFWVSLKWLVALLSAFATNALLIGSLGLVAPILALAVGYTTAAIVSISYWALRTPAITSSEDTEE